MAEIVMPINTESTSSPVQVTPEQSTLSTLISLLSRITRKTSFDRNDKVTITEGAIGLDGIQIKDPDTQMTIRVWTDRNGYRIMQDNCVFVIDREGNFRHTELLDPEDHILTDTQQSCREITGLSGRKEKERCFSNGVRGYWDVETGNFVGAVFDPLCITDPNQIHEISAQQGWEGEEYRVTHAGTPEIVTFWDVPSGVLLSTITYDKSSFKLFGNFTTPCWTGA